MSPLASEVSNQPIMPSTVPGLLPDIQVSAIVSDDIMMANDNAPLFKRPLLERRRKRQARRNSH